MMCSESLVVAGVESVIWGLSNVKGKEVIALAADPPVIAETETIITDVSESLLSAVNIDVIDGIIELVNVLVTLSADCWLNVGNWLVDVGIYRADLLRDLLCVGVNGVNARGASSWAAGDGTSRWQTSGSVGETLELVDQHVNVILLAVDDVWQVLDHDMESSDILTSVVAWAATGWDRWYWNNWWDENGCVSAVLEDSTVAASIVWLVALEHISIEAIVSSRIADSSLDYLSPLLMTEIDLMSAWWISIPSTIATAWSLSGIAVSVLLSLVTVPLVPPVLVVQGTSGSLSANLD